MRSGFATALVLGYAAWSLWDGFIGYPFENVAAAWRETLALPATGTLPLPDSRLSPGVARSVRIGATFDSLPAWSQEPGFARGDRRYFFGPAGHLVVVVTDGKVTASEWTGGPRRSSADLAFQKLVGFVLAPIGLYMAFRFVRTCTFRVELDERGLRLGRARSIAFGSISELRAVGPPGCGAYQLTWRSRNKTRRFRFDGYTLRRAEALARALQERLGNSGPHSADTTAPRSADPAVDRLGRERTV